MTTQVIAPWTILPFNTPDVIDLAKKEKWLQLTQASQRPAKGSIESRSAFASAGKIVHLEFDYLSWGGNGGKGLAIYLFDAGAANAGTGGIGGVGLGYVKMIGAYIGIGLDESASFTLIKPNAMTENSKDIAVGLDSAVTVRGSQARSYSCDSTNKVPKSLPLFSSAAQYKTRQEAVAAGGTKHVLVHFTPKANQLGYSIDLSINGVLFLNKFDYPYPAPASMKIGVAATNGPDTGSNHEVRNFRADVADPAPPPVDLLQGKLAYVSHEGTSGFITVDFLTNGDRVHDGWDGSGPWDQYPPDHLNYFILSSGVEINTIVIYCRQDDGPKQEPTDTTTFTQHGAIDFLLHIQDEYRNISDIASVFGNNLVKRTLSIPNARYEAVWITVNHAASHGASIVAVQGYKL